MADCVSKTLEAFPEADRADIKALHDAMSEQRRQAFMDGLSNPDSEFRNKSVKILEDFRKSVLSSKIEVLENIKKGQQRDAFVTNAAFKDKQEGLRALMAGTFKKIEGGRKSIDARQKTIANMLRSSLADDLADRSDLVKIFNEGTIEKEIMQEVEQLAKKDGKPGVSGSMEAMELAKAVHKVNRLELQLLNESGANINTLDGYIMRQAHDSEAIKVAGYEKWRDKILPLLDDEKTFHRDFYKVDAEQYLKDVYADLIDGRPKILQSESSDQLVKIIGTPSNMAKRLEKGRKLFFKDASSFYEYNKDFGRKSLSDQLMSSINGTARSASLMQVFGTNPRASFEKMILGLSPSEQKRMNNYWAELDGSTSFSGHSPMAKYSQNVRMVTDMAKLGGTIFSQFGDLTTRAAVMQVHGENVLSAHLGAFQSFLQNVPPSQRREVARLTSINADSMIGDLFSRLGAEDGKPGLIVKAHQKFMTINGSRLWSEVNKSATAQQLSAGLGERISKDFAHLEPQYARIMTGYGIGPIEWDVMRKTAETMDGHTMVGYSGVTNLPPEQVWDSMRKGGKVDGTFTNSSFQRRQVQKYASETSQKIATYFNDRVGIAMNEAGARERAEVLRRGTLADTPEGQVMRFMAQFKSFPVTMVSKFWDMIDKELVSEKATAIGKGAAYGQAIAPLLVSTMMLGYLGESAKAIANNKTPPDPFSPKTIGSSMIRGGALGLYGDYLLGEFDSRHGRSALSAIGGPVLGQFDDVMDFYTNLKQGDAKASAAFRLFSNNLPYGNLPIRGALDYLFLHEMQDTLNPGYINRMRNRMKQQGQGFIFDE